MSLGDCVVFVSAGLLAPKKRDHVLVRRQVYLNYGALTLASLVERDGIRSVLVNAGHDSPKETLRNLREQHLVPSRYPLMLSLPSFYALAWAQEFCQALRAVDRDCVIVAGGRWVTSGDPDWLRHRIPELDIVVPGLGKSVVRELIRTGRVTLDGSQSVPLPQFPLNHRLVRNFEIFQPSIEASRGCGMGCAFCEERAIPLSKLRDPDVLAVYFERALVDYNGGEIHFYVQSSFFLPNVRWAEQFNRAMRERGLAIKWRCETRVDAMTPHTLEQLAAAGLKIIDLGLETASPPQIAAMNKSTRADRYLRSASDLLRLAKQTESGLK